MANAKAFLEIVQLLVGIGAVFVGGIGAYYKFFYGRVYFTRLEPTFTTSFHDKDGTAYLLVKSGLKNTGQNNVHLCPSRQYIVLEATDNIRNAQHIENCHFDHLKTMGIFKEEEELEAGETIYEECIIALPANEVRPLNVILEVRAKKSIDCFESLRLWKWRLRKKNLRFNRRYFPRFARGLNYRVASKIWRNRPKDKYYIWRCKKIVIRESIA